MILDVDRTASQQHQKACPYFSHGKENSSLDANAEALIITYFL
jgi:hypothetical protein